MANDLSVIEHKILARGLMVLRERVVMPRLVNNSYSRDAAEKGDVVNVPIPVDQAAKIVTPATTPPTPDSNTPTNVQIALDQWYHADFHLTDKEMMEVDRNEHFMPMQAGSAVKGLANQVNQHILGKYLGVYGYHGTAGTTPFGSISNVTDATSLRKILNQQLTPKDERRLVLDYDAEANALALSQFSSFDEVGSSEARIQGTIGRKYGFDIAADDHVPTHTAGTAAVDTDVIAVDQVGTPPVAGDKTMVVDVAVGTSTWVIGDVFTIASISGKTFVATNAGTFDTIGVSLNFEPALPENVADGVALTFKASHVVNLGFHRDAFAFATRPLAASAADSQLGARVTSMQDPVSGIVLRLEVLRQYKQTVWDFDILWGSQLVRPELAARLAG